MEIFLDCSMLESAPNREALLKISRNGQDIMHQIEQSKKPVVAAVAGSCLGGGFEVCLSITDHSFHWKKMCFFC